MEMEFRIGSYTLNTLSDGRIWLDGGAMFGVVPKPLWSRIIEVDERNRVPLETRSLLIRGDAGTILVETGIGDHYSEKQHEIYKFDFSDRLLDHLSDLNVAPEDVDVVIQTHLHFDHCGSLILKSGNAHAPAFPNAEYIIQRGEWEAAHKPDSRSAPSYFPPEFYNALSDTGRLRLVEGEHKVAPGIQVRQMGGHTRHHQIVEVSQGDEKAVFVGDFIPMTRHINTAYSMGFDMFPVTTVEHKEAFLPQAAENDWILVFVHDPDTPLARVRRDGNKWTTEAVRP